MPLRYPAAGSADFFVSGYADGAEALGGTAAIVDEPVGAGRTVAFGFEPNFRAFTDGTQTLLRNAILGADPAPRRRRGSPAVRSPARGPRRARAARRLRSARGAVRLVVRRADARAARAVRPAREGRRVRVVRGGGRVTFLDRRSGRDRSGDEHRWAPALERALRDAGRARRDVPRAVAHPMRSPPAGGLRIERVAHTPSTRMICVSLAAWRMALSGAYSSDSYQARAAAASGNSMITQRSWGHGPSST